MTLENYQQEAKRTMNPNTTKTLDLLNYTLGLAGETGEVSEHIKKYVFHSKELNIKEITKELGDVLWYLTALAESLSINLSSIAQTNIDKLKERHPQGFTTEYKSKDETK